MTWLEFGEFEIRKWLRSFSLSLRSVGSLSFIIPKRWWYLVGLRLVLFLVVIEIVVKIFWLVTYVVLAIIIIFAFKQFVSHSISLDDKCMRTPQKFLRTILLWQSKSLGSFEPDLSQASRTKGIRSTRGIERDPRMNCHLVYHSTSQHTVSPSVDPIE